MTATATGNPTSGDGEVSTAVANCPSGKQAVGGGFALPSVDLDTNRLFVVSSHAQRARRAWTVTALNKDGSGSVAAYAYCRNSNRPVTDVVGTGTVPSGGGASGPASSTCPSGTRLVSGGFQSTSDRGPSNLPVRASHQQHEHRCGHLVDDGGERLNRSAHRHRSRLLHGRDRAPGDPDGGRLADPGPDARTVAQLAGVPAGPRRRRARRSGRRSPPSCSPPVGSTRSQSTSPIVDLQRVAGSIRRPGSTRAPT